MWSFKLRGLSSPTFGALLEYVGMGKFVCQLPGQLDTLPFSYAEPNCYALDTGGVKGTLWRVIAVERLLEEGEFHVLEVTVELVDRQISTHTVY